MEKIEAPQSDEATIKFQFPQPARSGLQVITLRDLHHAYGATAVYHGVDLAVERGQRIVLVGPNGAGKSTLLKLLAGVLPVQQGTRSLGTNVQLGYYAQHRIENLDPGRTVLEEALSTPQMLSEQSARTVLGSFLFRGDDVFKQVAVLSGGEKSRLALVKLLLDPPNLLLMDEPTTHLDLGSIEALIRALAPYRGTLVFISHDEYFIHQLARHVLHIDAGLLTHYHGDYRYYLDRRANETAAAAAAGPAVAPATVVPRSSRHDRKQQKRAAAEARQARSRARQAQRENVERLEREIERLETRQKELTAALEDPATYDNPGRAVAVNRELMDLAAALERCNAEWERAAGEMTGGDDAAATV